MNRSRLEPLGVPGTEYDIEEAASRHGPSALDRWLLKQIVTRLGPESPVRATLWDTPDVAPRDGAVSVRILDRKALWQIVVNPALHFGDLYSAGRVQVRGDLLTMLLEAYRFTDKHSALRDVLAHGRKLAPDRRHFRILCGILSTLPAAFDQLVQPKRALPQPPEPPGVHGLLLSLLSMLL